MEIGVWASGSGGRREGRHALEPKVAEVEREREQEFGRQLGVGRESRRMKKGCWVALVRVQNRGNKGSFGYEQLNKRG